MVGVRPAYVWDVSQTTGDPLPTKPEPRLLTGEAPEGLREGLAGRIGSEGFELLWVPHCEVPGHRVNDVPGLHTTWSRGESNP